MNKVKFETLGEFKGAIKDTIAEMKAAKLHPHYVQYGSSAEVFYLKQDIRTLHLAYCLLRGTPYEKIEPKVREGNAPDMRLVKDIVEANKDLLVRDEVQQKPEHDDRAA